MYKPLWSSSKVLDWYGDAGSIPRYGSPFSSKAVVCPSQLMKKKLTVPITAAQLNAGSFWWWQCSLRHSSHSPHLLRSQSPPVTLQTWLCLAIPTTNQPTNCSAPSVQNRLVKKTVLTLQIRTFRSLCFFTIPVFQGLTCLPQAVQKRFSSTVALLLAVRKKEQEDWAVQVIIILIRAWDEIP